MSMSRTFGKGFSDTGSRRSKASRASKGSRVRSIGSSKTGKSSKKQVDEEAEFQKLIQSKLHKISNFDSGEPPSDEFILNILE